MIKAWIQAFRLRTLPLAFSCILMGAFLAASVDQFDGVILVLSLLTTLFLQVLSNLANDFGDATSGVDSDHRQGPRRTVQSGLISLAQMKKALFVFVVLSLISGISLIVYAFPGEWITLMFFLILGLAAIGAAIKYTVGKSPYGYTGFGDLFVLLFFGYVGVNGSYFLYTSSFDYLVLLPATSCGLLAVGVLNVNNIRDIESDRQSGKFSIPVRIGRHYAVLYHFLLLAGAFIAAVAYAYLRDFQGWEWSFLAFAILLLWNARAVAKGKNPKELDPFLKQLALTTLLFVVLFGLGVI